MKRQFQAALLAALSLAFVPMVNAESNGDLIVGFTTQSGTDQIFDLGPLASLSDGQTWSAATLGISGGTYNWGVIGSASAAMSGNAYDTVWTTIAAGIPPQITGQSDWNAVDVGISSIVNELPGGLGGFMANTGASMAATDANSWNMQTINGLLVPDYHVAYLNPNVVNQATACLYTVNDNTGPGLAGNFGLIRQPVLAGTFTLSTNGTLTFHVVVFPPMAAFYGNVISGFVPLQVVFSDASTGSITNWLWSFGDGNSLTNNTNGNVTNTYAATGNYTVTLTVSGAGGSGSETQSNYVSVYPVPPAPVAGFTGTPNNGPAPLPVAFSDASSGVITNWVWSATSGFQLIVQQSKEGPLPSWSIVLLTLAVFTIGAWFSRRQNPNGHQCGKPGGFQ